MPLLLLLLVIGLIIFLEAPELLQKQMWGELMVFSFLLALGALFAGIEALDLRVPTPTQLTEALFRPVAELLDNLLK